MRHVKSIVLLATLASLALGLAACNTVKGAGKDLQRGGQAIESAADRAAN